MRVQAIQRRVNKEAANHGEEQLAARRDQRGSENLRDGIGRLVLGHAYRRFTRLRKQERR
jgi:hypothetical protein